MFGQLIESKRRRSRRAGEAVVSVLAHGAIVGGAVFLTASTGPAAAVPEPLVRPIEYIHVEEPEPRERTESRPVDRHGMLHEGLPREVTVIDAPIDVPTTLPPIGEMPHEEREISFGPSSPLGSGVLGTSPGATSGELGALSAQAVDRIATLLGDVVRPRYPESLRTAGVGGRVLVRFVVDTTGRVEQGSVQTLAASHRDFEVAVRDVLPRMRFRPAEVRSRKVRMLVEMPFEFALRNR